MPMNPEVDIELSLLAKEIGLVQMPAEVLHCSGCFNPLYLSEKIHRVPVTHKRALNKPAHHDGSAIAYMCDGCKTEGKEPLIVIHREGHHRKRCLEINIEDLPDK